MAKKKPIIPANTAVAVVEKPPVATKPKKPRSRKKPAAKPPAAAAPANGKRSYSPRRALNYVETPDAVLVGSSPIIKGAFKTQAEALDFISKLPLEQCTVASLCEVKPVKVDVKTTVSL
jgi:hypothetical protein